MGRAAQAGTTAANSGGHWPQAVAHGSGNHADAGRTNPGLTTARSAVVKDAGVAGWQYLKGCLLAEAGKVHATEFLFELGDLVAQPGGQLELQFAGSAHHLVGELLDQIR